ncbi:MAG: hypothetical protein GF331_10500, partial [Chitinivibrionales bacterium]|nr:hypothetical protein [Chitinivibrionales bacterium]
LDAVDWYQNTVGVDLYALSFANEPDFAQSFNSCVWAGEQYRDFVKMLGPALRAKDPTVKVFGAERMLRDFGQTCAKTLIDPEAAPYLDVVAVHGYSDGVEAENLDQLKNYWGGTRSVRSFIHGGNPASKKMDAWMTETSGYATNWDGAMQLARSIFYALGWGDVSAWVWWQLCSSSSPNVYELMSHGNPTERYYASKHFYRWIRPDAVRIDATTADSTVELLAFNHKAHKTLTVIAINPTSGTKQISLQGNNLPSSFEVYRSTSSNQNCSQQADHSSGGTLSLPANSITTLYGTGYNPPAVKITPESLARARALQARVAGQIAEVYDLNGRLVGRKVNAVSRGQATGVRVVRSRIGDASIGSSRVVGQ